LEDPFSWRERWIGVGEKDDLIAFGPFHADADMGDMGMIIAEVTDLPF
jgi:hypothetical protein